jgi:LAS superfamily LD-carboxypeptidase LdcB
MVEGRNGEGGNDSYVVFELKKDAVFALSYLNKALELNFKNLFRKSSFKSYIYKEKTFEKILQRITEKSQR